MEKKIQKFNAYVVADGKSFECTLYAFSIEDAQAQAEKDAPKGASSITVEPALVDFAVSEDIALDIDSALAGKAAAKLVPVLAPVAAAKPVDLGAMVTLALAAKDKLIATLTAERNSLRSQLIAQRR